MTITRLKEIAAHHRQTAAKYRNEAADAAKSGHVLTAREDSEMAEFHEAAAHDLNQLATAFEAVGPLLTSGK